LKEVKIMSVATKGGDDGSTGMLFGHRISKSNDHIEAVGAVDEFTTALGVVRALDLTHGKGYRVPIVKAVQDVLINLMGELSTFPKEYDKFKGMFGAVSSEDLKVLDDEVKTLESRLPKMKGWSIPGATGSMLASHIEVARTACRRAERRVVALGVGATNPLVIQYLNRASDMLWLMARDEETVKEPVNAHS